LTDGRRLTTTSDAYQPLGNLLAQKKIMKKKFLSLVEPMLGSKAAMELMTSILAVDRLDSAGTLLAFSQNKRAGS
jgi:hypothetical protein